MPGCRLTRYIKIDENGKRHKRIDIVKNVNGKIKQVTIEVSGDYAGGVVTYIDDITSSREKRKTEEASTIE